MNSRQGRSGKRPVLMQDVADIAGVSKSTVSRALAWSPLISDATKQSVLAVARKCGYRLNMRARDFQSSDALTIAVVVQEPGHNDWSFADAFFLELLGCIADELSPCGGIKRRHRVEGRVWTRVLARWPIRQKPHWSCRDKDRKRQDSDAGIFLENP